MQRGNVPARMLANEENAIRNIQRYLRQLSYFEPSIGTNIIIDGVYTANTRQGVVVFQQMNGLTATGVVDKITWDLLFKEYLQSISDNSSAGEISAFFDSPKGYSLKIGDTNALVRLVELMLEEVSAIYVELENMITDNGIYDESKVQAITFYQQINKIPVTGNLDKTTWDRLARDYSMILRKNAAQ